MPIYYKRGLLYVCVIAVFAVGSYFLLDIFWKKPVSTPEIVDQVKAEPSTKIIGVSIEGRNIEVYTFGTGPKQLLFVGGIHGGYEWNSVLLAYKFVDYFKQNSSVVPKDLTIAIVPSLNPDGLFKVIKKEGRFELSDVPSGPQALLDSGRFNSHKVDLNRNFDCKWKPEAVWKNQKVSAGTAPFSEPEATALRDFILEYKPKSVVFWHSQANTVYASKCEGEIIPETIDIMNAYAKASSYNAVKTFDAYPTTGDAEGWLASIGIPAITVELKTHEDIEWEKNLKGVEAILDYYGD